MRQRSFPFVTKYRLICLLLYLTIYNDSLKTYNCLFIYLVKILHCTRNLFLKYNLFCTMILTSSSKFYYTERFLIAFVFQWFPKTRLIQLFKLVKRFKFTQILIFWDLSWRHIIKRIYFDSLSFVTNANWEHEFVMKIFWNPGRSMCWRHCSLPKWFW